MLLTRFVQDQLTQDALHIHLRLTYQKVDSKTEILDQLILGHVDGSYRSGEAENFLHLELDRAFHFIYLQQMLHCTKLTALDNAELLLFSDWSGRFYF